MDNVYDARHLQKLSIGQLVKEFSSAHIKELMRRGYPDRTIAHFYQMPLDDFIRNREELVSPNDAQKARDYAAANNKPKPKPDKEAYVPTPLQESIINHIVKCKGLKEDDL